MKYLKSSIRVLIILAALMVALHVHAQQKARQGGPDLYFYNGTTYVPAGEYGWDFYCDGNTGVCVYYRPDPVFDPYNYAVYQYGAHTLIP